MDGYYDPSIVALSVAVAIIASYTALDMAARVSASWTEVEGNRGGG